MNSKTITYFKIAVVEISLWLIFVLQGANLDNVYFLFYLPLLFTACFIFVSPISREKLFNKYVGINLHSYINNIRIQKVLEMKSNPKNSQSLISIALDCGFNSQASFYRALQQYRQNYPSNM